MNIIESDRQLMKNRQDTIRKIDKLNNFYKYHVEYSKMDVASKVLLQKNAQYKDMYRGKRCFVFGNAPSINNLDFSRFKDEVVITVNELFRHEEFHKLHSNFHFIADPAYFDLKRERESDLKLINQLKDLGEREDKPLFFVPLNSKKTIHRYGWDKKLDVHYFESRLYFYDDYEEEIDYAKIIPGFHAVIHWAIAFAVYAGFKEIYLLGCDATNIPIDISLACNVETDLKYAYSLSEEDTKSVKRKHQSMGLEDTLYGYYKIVHMFSELSKYCKIRNIKLYNCSSETVLTCIPKKGIDSVINRSNKDGT